MARFQRFRKAYSRGYFSKFSPYRTRRRSSKGGLFTGSFNPMFLVGFAVGMGVGRGYIPGIAQSGIALYGALPFSIKGLGMVKHFARGYIAGMVVSGITGINLGNMTGIGAGGSTAASPWG